MGRTDEVRVRLAGQVEVVAVASPAGEQAPILEASDGLAETLGKNGV
jgi:hypothetical protein